MSVTSISTSGAIFSPSLSGATGAVTIAAPDAIDTTSTAQIKAGNLTANTLTATGDLVVDAGAKIGSTLGVTGAATATSFGTPNTNGIFAVHNVRDYGAKGNGTNDDSTAIRAAVTAATAYAALYGGGAVVFFPPGDYYYDSASAITIENGVAVHSMGGAIIRGGSSTTDCFVYSATNAGGGETSIASGPETIPSVYGFANGWGLRIKTNIRHITFQSIQSCGVGCGIDSTASSTATVVNNTVRGMYVSQCTSGVEMLCSNNAQTVQGHIFDINFVTGCSYSLSFNSLSGTLISPACSGNAYYLHAIDNTGAAAGTASCCLNNANGLFTTGQYVVVCDTYFTSIGTLFYLPNHFDVSMRLAFNFGTVAPSFVGTIPTSSVIFPIGGAFMFSIGNLSALSYVALTTAQGTRADFNGGNAVLTNTMLVQATIPTGGLSAGGYVDYFGFNDLLCGSTPIMGQLVHNQYPVVIICAEDETTAAGIFGGPYAKQFHIRLMAFGNVPATAIIPMFLQLGPIT